MKKFLTFFAVAAVAVAAAVSCQKAPEAQNQEVALKSISIDPASFELQVGATKTLAVKYFPENATNKPAIEWSTSDAKVATVKDGVVTAVAAGEATITAKAGDLKAEAKVKVTAEPVTDIPLESISIEPASLDLKVGQTADLKVKYNPENATEKPAIEWSSSNAAVAAVANGKVTAVAAGEAVITAKAGDKKAEARVVVSQEAQPSGIIDIDGDFSDWAAIPGVSEGSYGMFKVVMDDNYIYFYTWRTTEGRYADIWEKNGYVYIGMDLDLNMETGETLWGNGPYEFVGVLYPFGGTKDAPAIDEAPGADCLPETATLANVICKGVIDAEGAKIEYRIPRADLPAIPEIFDVYSWGNKDLSKVRLHYGEEEKYWDFTPSAEYSAADNIWKPLDPDGVMIFHYHCVGADWNGENLIEPYADCDLVRFGQSTYMVTYEDATSWDWQNQFYMFPALDKAIALQAEGEYKLKFTLGSNQNCNAFFKIVKYNADKVAAENKPEGDVLWEWGRNALTAFEPVVIESPVITGQDAENIVLLFDFGGNPANTEFYIKDIIFQAKEPKTWDFTPSVNYSSPKNLWKANAEGNELVFFYQRNTFDNTIAPIAESGIAALKESTYVLTYEAATSGDWENQFALYPALDHAIALDPAKSYKLKFIVGASVDMNIFFKAVEYNADKVIAENKPEGPGIWEWGRYAVTAFEPVAIESAVITGVETSDLVLFFDFGGNPAGANVFIKDVYFEEYDGSGSGSDIPDYNPITYEW